MSRDPHSPSMAKDGDMGHATAVDNASSFRGAHSHHHHAHNGTNGSPPPPHLYQSAGFPAYDRYQKRKTANPAPLGLCAFALTTFVLSAINLGTRGLKEPHIVISLAFGYGGLVQLLAGMWEMAVGNTFGATALSSYGGFWIAYGLLLTPTWGVAAAYESQRNDATDFNSAVGLFLMGWFIFTFILLLCTLRTSLAFFLLFLLLDVTFLLLACAEFAANNKNASMASNLTKAGGAVGIVTAFAAWYNAAVGIMESGEWFFVPPVYHFPWSPKAHDLRVAKRNNGAV